MIDAFNYCIIFLFVSFRVLRFEVEMYLNQSCSKRDKNLTSQSKEESAQKTLLVSTTTTL